MNFVWNMTEEQLHKLYHGIGNDVFCGNLFFGQCVCDFRYEDIGLGKHIPYAELFAFIDHDAGYATLADGTHYNNFGECFDLPEGSEFSSLEEFKKICEARIVKAVKTYSKDLAAKAEGPAQVKTWQQPLKY